MKLSAALFSLAAATAVVAGVAPSAAAIPPPAHMRGPEVGVDINPVDLGNTIANAVKTSQNRDGFVKNLCETAYNNLGHQKYNVMVFNLSQAYDASGLRDVAGYRSATYDHVVYGVWLFDSGRFVNKGDGGYINWCFKGSFKRSGNQGHTVDFN